MGLVCDPKMGPCRLAIVGAGLVGKRHAAAIDMHRDIELTAIVDPSDAGRDFAGDRGVPCYDNIDSLLVAQQINGVILSTPTPLHLEHGLSCIANGIPALIEKPLATDAQEAKQLVDASKETNVPILVGHHRRHNPIIDEAHHLIAEGRIGEVRIIHAQCWFYKPDKYFDCAPWRKRPGAGPISVNLVHEVDLLRYLCGEIINVQVQALSSSRGFDNEEAAAMTLRFANGAIGTISVADSVVSPWSWELTSGEYPVYPRTGESCYRIGGTHGALSIPDMAVWSYRDQRDWWAPISATYLPRSSLDPLVRQIGHFAAVIAGRASPLVSANEGYQTMKVIECMSKSALSGEMVCVPQSEDSQTSSDNGLRAS